MEGSDPIFATFGIRVLIWQNHELVDISSSLQCSWAIKFVTSSYSLADTAKSHHGQNREPVISYSHGNVDLHLHLSSLSVAVKHYIMTVSSVLGTSRLPIMPLPPSHHGLLPIRIFLKTPTTYLPEIQKFLALLNKMTKQYIKVCFYK